MFRRLKKYLEVEVDKSKFDLNLHDNSTELFRLYLAYEVATLYDFIPTYPSEIELVEIKTELESSGVPSVSKELLKEVVDKYTGYSGSSIVSKIINIFSTFKS